MITAEEVRMLMPSNKDEERLKITLEEIKEAAKKDRTECRVPYEVLDKSSAYSQCEPETGTNKKLCESLIELGFTIESICVFSQFADLGIKISWKKTDV